MKPRYLFPYFFRRIGYICLGAVILLGVILKVLLPQGFTHELHHNPEFGMKLTHDITALLILFGLVFIAFSKEKVEDEHISLIRLESLQWAVYLNYIILGVCVVLINPMELMQIILMCVWAPLVFFIIRFRWKIYSLNHEIKKENQA
jgi:hypothetical protein